tara:strand:+ start:170 stop:967 length:798 start_codon:yes stop_codon:yes gene_type:complete
MSSIYKKGRDGYYYYQAYVHNSDTNKKDKRIFHALGTKDLQKAKAKQIELDLQYEKRSRSVNNSTNLLINLKFQPIIITVLLIVGLAIILFELINAYMFDKNTNAIIVQNHISEVKKNNGMVELKKSVESKPFASKNHQTLSQKKLIPKSKENVSKITIPSHTVERIDTLSDSFNQGKLYVTIDKNLSKESQHLLCSDLMKRYSEFSNIIICLYTNNRAGKNLAKGNDELISAEEQKRSWLVMYTYNSVEGEYFDDNPGGYISAY